MLEVRSPEEFRERVLESDAPTVVMFWATWCPFCRRFKVEFDRLAERLRAEFASVYLDDYESPLWEDYDVSVVPTLALFRGGELVDREDGVLGYGIDRARAEAFAARVAPRLP
ncbi:MAG: hypothetical protein A3K66_07615 [Euryarchaeota archaeon RBG_16_67_27]|nr:MAG: hypothetical protein A3K66_07615 [Euryarchaeota archaeon RBG_16_67_27]